MRFAQKDLLVAEIEVSVEGRQRLPIFDRRELLAQHRVHGQLCDELPVHRSQSVLKVGPGPPVVELELYYGCTDSGSGQTCTNVRNDRHGRQSLARPRALLMALQPSKPLEIVVA